MRRVKLLFLGLALISVLAVSLTLSGYVNRILARKLVQAPNQQTLPKNLVAMDLTRMVEQKDPKIWEKALQDSPMVKNHRVNVGSPAVALAVVTIEPADHRATVELRMTRERGHHREEFNINLTMGEKTQPAKGTIVLLHGICMRKETMIAWALYLGAAGYRTVLVDLRGHGASGGEFITYGNQESRDLSAVMDVLEKEGLVTGKVGVLGISYGATMGLHWAARDQRVGAAVAIEPFADPKRAITDFVRQLSGPSQFLSGARLKAIIEQVPREAGFAWKDVSVYEAVEKITFPILFYHGTHDRLLPMWHSAGLKDWALPGSRLVVCVDDDHLTLAKRLEPYASEVLAWFDEKLGHGQNATAAK